MMTISRLSGFTAVAMSNQVRQPRFSAGQVNYIARGFNQYWGKYMPSSESPEVFNGKSLEGEEMSVWSPQMSKLRNQNGSWSLEEAIAQGNKFQDSDIREVLLKAQEKMPDGYTLDLISSCGQSETAELKDTSGKLIQRYGRIIGQESIYGFYKRLAKEVIDFASTK